MKPLLLIPLLLLAAGATAVARDAYVEGSVIVTFSPDAEAAAKDHPARGPLRLSRRFDEIGRRQGRVTGIVTEPGTTTAELIDRLKNQPGVESVEPDYLRRICSPGDSDPSYHLLWGHHNTGQIVNGVSGAAGADVNFPAAWLLANPDEREIVVAIIDTGLDIGHPDLIPNLWTNPGEIPGNHLDDDGNGYIDDVHGYDFSLGTSAMTDSGDHGTHIAGTIAAAADNHTGVIGVDFRTKILPLKVSTDGDTMRSSAVLAAINYVIALKQRGVNIVAVNASYGGETFINAEFTAARALRDAGIVLCAAAGNDGTDNDTTPGYPASYEVSNIIAVAATTQRDALAPFSNYGARSVDIGAPGSNIYSTLPLALAESTTTLTVGGVDFPAAPIAYAGRTDAAGITGSLHACGIGNPSEFPPAVAGNIALILRGTLTFAEKVANAKAAGARAAIIYDDTADPLPAGGAWTLGATGDWLPALQITNASGGDILDLLPASVTVANVSDPSRAYRFLNGTSMATPYVAAAVAFAARNFPDESMSQRVARILDHTVPLSALAGKTTTGGRLDLLKIVDTDSDQLPDWWETRHFGNLAQTAAGDPDGDGIPNLDEFLAASDPTTAGPRLAFSSYTTVTDESGVRFVLAFPTVAGKTYHVEWSATLAPDSWQTLGSPVPGTGGLVEIPDPVVAPRRFYRLRRTE